MRKDQTLGMPADQIGGIQVYFAYRLKIRVLIFISTCSFYMCYSQVQSLIVIDCVTSDTISNRTCKVLGSGSAKSAIPKHGDTLLVSAESYVSTVWVYDDKIGTNIIELCPLNYFIPLVEIKESKKQREQISKKPDLYMPIPVVLEFAIPFQISSQVSSSISLVFGKRSSDLKMMNLEYEIWNSDSVHHLPSRRISPTFPIDLESQTGMIKYLLYFEDSTRLNLTINKLYYIIIRNANNDIIKRDPRRQLQLKTMTSFPLYKSKKDSTRCL